MKKFIFLTVTVLSGLGIYAQSTFQKYIKTGIKSYNNRLIGTADGGYINIGEMNDVDSTGDTTHILVITKLDNNANVGWIKAFRDTTARNPIRSNSLYPPLNIVQIADDGYIIATSPPMVIFKLNGAGELQWCRELGFSDPAYHFSTRTGMKAIQDDVMLTGALIQPTLPKVTSYVIQISGADGSIAWINAVNYKKNVRAERAYNVYSYAIEPMKDGGYTICGSITHSRNNFAFVAHFNKDHKLNGGTSFFGPTRFTDIKQRPNGDYLVIGNSQGGRAYSIFGTSVIDLDAAGNVRWGKRISIKEAGYPKNNLIVNNILINDDNSCIISGEREPLSDGYVFSLDSLGNQLWGKLIPHTGRHGVHLSSLVKTTDNGFLVAGDYGVDHSEYYGRIGYLGVYKFNGSGHTCIESTPAQSADPLYYNLFSDRIMLTKNLTSVISNADRKLESVHVNYAAIDLCNELPAAPVDNSNAYVPPTAGSFSAKIFPNPVTSGILNLHISNAIVLKLQMTIVNANGTVVFGKEMTVNAGTNNLSFPCTFPAGIYNVRMSDGKTMQAIKFVIAR